MIVKVSRLIGHCSVVFLSTNAANCYKRAILAKWSRVYCDKTTDARIMWLSLKSNTMSPFWHVTGKLEADDQSPSRHR